MTVSYYLTSEEELRLISVTSSSLVESIELMEFFRHCPECGRRFNIKLVSKKLVSKENKLIPTKRVVTGQYASFGGRYKGHSGGALSAIRRRSLWRANR